jgi:HAD superfamily hydrolase (TIGR01490 family)
MTLQLSSSVANRPIAAVFDFDGTLTTRDSLFSFLRFYSGWPTFALKVVRLSPLLLGYAMRLIRNDTAKEMTLTAFLRGAPMSDVKIAGAEFSAKALPRLLRQAALRRLEWHRNQGHRCILLSASLELYLRSWAKTVGFDDVIGSILEVSSEGIVTGRLVGGNCRGEEKVRRLAHLLGQPGHFVLYSYGDSSGDRPLLAISDHPFYRRFS